MKKFIAPMLVGATLATAAYAADDSLKAEIAALKVQMAELKEAQSKVNYEALKAQLMEVKAHDAGDNIKWTVDFRTAYDIIDQDQSAGMAMTPQFSGTTFTGYKMTPATAKSSSNSIWTNKLTLGMAAQPVDNLVFKGALGFYKAFGESSIGNYSMFQNFDWYGSSKPQGENVIRLKEAYLLYFGEMGDMPYTASFGRRPSTDGFMTNLRADNAHPASPVGHNINMEFDGASFKFDFDKLTGVSGLYFKICLGRGFSDTTGAYAYDFSEAYGSGFANPDMDIAGLLIQAYDDGQYKVMANVFQAWNVMGMKMAASDTLNPAGPTLTPTGFMDVGDMYGASLSLQVNGIGNEINDFLDDTVFFASYAMMKTDPNNVDAFSGFGPFNSAMNGMLGSTERETGYSYYTGINMPGFMESDRIGLEYNHGSKYWRSFTYGEDTLAGSKLATRGDAYEIYYNLPLVSKNLTAQIRYTYMDYDYAGSDMFFGMTGNPDGLASAMGYDTQTVESASNIHLALRYRY
jgi:hypothetical protein